LLVPRWYPPPVHRSWLASERTVWPHSRPPRAVPSSAILVWVEGCSLLSTFLVVVWVALQTVFGMASGVYVPSSWRTGPVRKPARPVREFWPVREPWDQFANRPSDMRTVCDNSYSQASISNKAGMSCNCKKSCDSRRCRCFKNGLECSIYCHSDDHDCGNMKRVAQRTEISLMPRPAWDRSEASDGDNEDEPAPVQPVQPRRILRAKSVLARTTVNRTTSGLAG